MFRCRDCCSRCCRCCRSGSSSLRSPGIIIHSPGNVTVLLAEERWPPRLQEPRHLFGGMRGERAGVRSLFLSISLSLSFFLLVSPSLVANTLREMVTYGRSRTLLNRDVNWPPQDVSLYSPFLSRPLWFADRGPVICITAMILHFGKADIKSDDNYSYGHGHRRKNQRQLYDIK